MAVVVNVYGKASLQQIDRAQAQLAAMRKEATAQAGPWRTMGSAISSTWAKIGSTVAAVAVARWLKGSLDAARQFQLEQRQLANAVMNTAAASGKGEAYWRAYAGRMHEVVAAQSQLSAYSKGDLEGALATLTQTTGSASKGLKLLSLATDLARAKHMDLGKAAQLVGRVADGNTGILKRYGIVIDKGTSATKALGILHQKFAGAAKVYGDSSAGAADKFHNSLQQLQITVGTALLPVINRLMGYLNTGLGLFQRLPGPVKTVVVALGAVAGVAAIMAPFATSIMAVGKAMQLAQLASKAWAAAQWLLNAAMDANPIGIAVVAIAALVAAFVIAYKKSETFRNVVLGAWNAIKAATLTVFNALVSFFKRWGPLVLAAFTGGLGPAVLYVVTHWRQIQTAASDAFNAVVGFARSFGSRVKSAVGDLGKLLYSVGRDIVMGLLNGITAYWHFVTDKLSSLIHGLSSAAKKLLGIGSPSKVFFAHGRWTGLGFAGGLDSTRSAVAAAGARVFGAAAGGGSFGSPAFAGAGGGSMGGAFIAPGAVVVHVTVSGDSSASPSAIGQAVTSAVTPSLARLAREVARVKRR
jgi:phage-related protein